MNLKINYGWKGLSEIESTSYVCGYCGNPLASEKGYTGSGILHQQSRHAFIYICHLCSRPTFFDDAGEQIPGVAFGNEVNGVDDKTVLNLYQEARRATSANCNTAAVLCCRKLLMHIAVSKGAEEKKPFIYYVEFFSKNNYIPPGAKIWVDYIRKKGNEANHEINIMRPEDAKELIEFTEMLMKIIYEFPETVRKKYPQESNLPKTPQIGTK